MPYRIIDPMPYSDPDTLRETVARHDAQIQDHDRVLRALEDHLRQLVDSFQSFQTKVLVAAAFFLAGSSTGEHVLKGLGLL
jgi:hypothetical protein